MVCVNVIWGLQSKLELINVGFVTQETGNKTNFVSKETGNKTNFVFLVGWAPNYGKGV